MDNSLLRELGSRYGLSSFEIKIIRSLHRDEMTADEICVKTGIPKGRIYTLLNMLIRKRLIEKIEKNPASYSAGNFEKKVAVFLDMTFHDNQLYEKEMISVLNQAEAGKIELLNDSAKYMKDVLKMLSECKKMDIILRHGVSPIILYPKEKKDFLKIRKWISTYRPTFTGIGESSYIFFAKYHELAESRKINYVATEESVINYFNAVKKCFGGKRFKIFVKTKLQAIRNHNLGIRLLKASFPYSLNVSETNAMIALVYRKSILGFTTTSRQIIDIYQNTFKGSFSQGMPIQRVISRNYGIDL